MDDLLHCFQVDDQKEDFSDFPPNQRRKKLLQKIDSIKKEIAREAAERYVFSKNYKKF